MWACDMGEHMPLLANVTYLTHYGLMNGMSDQAEHKHGVPCFTPGKDVVMPPALGTRLGFDAADARRAFEVPMKTTATKSMLKWVNRIVVRI
eukprot:1182787-Prorocentrum_minimum.AAC.3